MTPNLRLDQHCRVETALGKRLRDIRDKIEHSGIRLLTAEEIHEEIRQRRGERELERVL